MPNMLIWLEENRFVETVLLSQDLFFFIPYCLFSLALS